VAVEQLKAALANTDQIELTVTGRVSGQQISNPVWFVQEGDTLYLLPVYGSRGQWYRNVLQTPTIHVAADGGELDVEASPITDGDQVAGVIDKFRAKYGADQISRYYSNPDVAVEVPLAAGASS
jgi:hypothetical protein